MINALHLLWIVPLAGSVGVFFMALVAAGHNSAASQPGTPACKPEHCWECAHTFNCNTAYGWSGCRYQDAITRETISQTIGNEENWEESV